MTDPITKTYHLKPGHTGDLIVKAYEKDETTMIIVVSPTWENRWDLESFFEIYEEVTDAQGNRLRTEEEQKEKENARG